MKWSRFYLRIALLGNLQRLLLSRAFRCAKFHIIIPIPFIIFASNSANYLIDLVRQFRVLQTALRNCSSYFFRKTIKRNTYTIYKDHLRLKGWNRTRTVIITRVYRIHVARMSHVRSKKFYASNASSDSW